MSDNKPAQGLTTCDHPVHVAAVTDLKLKVFRVRLGGAVEWYVAESPDDVRAIVTDSYGDEFDDEFSSGEASPEAMPEGRELRISTEGYGSDAGCVTRTCAEWAAENGRGKLASTEY